MFISKVTSRGQITLPSEFRKKEGIGDSDYVVMREVGEAIILSKLTSRVDEITSVFEKKAKAKGITKKELLAELDVLRGKR